MTIDNIKVIWQPHPGSQTIFLSSPYWETLYEGTRGPGKTDAMIMDYAQHVGQGYGEAWRGILFRQTYKQLADVVTKTKKWYRRIFPGATFNESEFKWKFPDGEELLLRYMSKPEDYWEYHGHEYPWIGWNELTNWPTDECYEMMKSCSRSSYPGMPRKIRADTNPWGRGHHWVKQYFIDPAPPNVPIETTFQNPLTNETEVVKRVRISGDILENTTLLTADPNYLRVLESIKDPEMKKAWRYGSWDIASGGFFGDIWNSSRNVIDDWMPPPDWKVYRSLDWGSARPFSVGFWAISDGNEAPDGKFYPRGAMIRFREWYGIKNGEPNTGLRMTARQVAQGIREIEQSLWENHGIKVEPGPADNQIWARENDKSVADDMESEHVEWEKSNKDRHHGWQQMRYRISPDDEDAPLLYVQRSCINWLRTVPLLERSEKDWDDIDTDSEDHAADETRYMCMFSPREVSIQKLVGF